MIKWTAEKYEFIRKNYPSNGCQNTKALFQEYYEVYSLPFRYVGDGSFIIEGKNPDFVDVNGKKVCVEVHCGVFDRLQKRVNYESERKEFFGRYGWDCIVFMQDKTRRLDESEMRRTLEAAGYEFNTPDLAKCAEP